MAQNSTLKRGRSPSTKVLGDKSVLVFPKDGLSSPTTKKVKHTANQDVKPGDPNNTTTFVDLHRHEIDLSQYCSLDGIEELRNFAMTPQVLKAYVNAFTNSLYVVYPGGPKRWDIYPGMVLDYLRDHPQEIISEEDPVSKYQHSTRSDHVLQRVALASAQLYRRLTDLQSKLPDLKNVEKEFKLLTGKTPPITHTTKLVANLGPFPERGECILEGYNRCYNLLRYISLSVQYTDLWDRRFGKSRVENVSEIEAAGVQHLASENTISPSAEHLGMQPPPSGNHLQPPLEDKSHSLTVEWNPHSKVPWAVELWTSLEHRGLVSKVQAKKSIRIHPNDTVYELRDRIRLIFDMQALGAQIKTLITLPNGTDVMRDEWSKVEEDIWGKDAPERSLTLRMSLRKLEEGEMLLEI
ncbi:hypothetical protein DM02DRAFT_616543 [Periconia macrospinosa]|uniref:Uncharacterized protein n=1 Tax=Periconia macrospinosa TaxID=97972 RepID=A0A2V1DJT7_9PLEO|nr:hypothetical protein DM02DRAFT_616543 [Periconia macrospinosa]